MTFEPLYDKTYHKTCATSEDSYQPAHLHSLIKFFADRTCFLQPPGYPKKDNENPLPYWVNAQADLCLHCSHKS